MSERIGTVQLIQKMNRVLVLDRLRAGGEMSRAELSAETGMSLASITNIVKYLAECGYVREVGTVATSKAGRRTELLAFNQTAGELAVVHVEANEVYFARCDLLGSILEQGCMPTLVAQSGAVMETVRQVLSKIVNERTLGVGVAISGHVDNRGAVSSVQLNWDGYPVREKLLAEGFPNVFVVNNSRSKAMGLSEPIVDGVFLDLSDGLGLVRFLGGRVDEGVSGELGHTTVMKDGPLCACGNYGCLEIVVSPGYLQKQFGGNLERMLEAYENGERVPALVEAAEYLGIGLANVISLFEPPCIVINPNCMTKKDRFYHSVLEYAQRRLGRLSLRRVMYLRSEVTHEAALAGLARHVADGIFGVDGNVV